MGIVTEEQGSVWEEMAAKHGVIAEIHPLDYLFDFLFKNESFPTKAQAIRYYFDDGADSARQLHDLLTRVCGLADTRFRMLEFAAGYGLVTRHLPKLFPRATITSCDIHRSAVRFLEEKIGVQGLLSKTVPEEFVAPTNYDVVFALAFFSSMPKTTWSRWLERLWDAVAEGGFMIFTTQGRKSAVYYEAVKLDEDGFWFAPLSEQKDLSTEDYGQAIVHPRYVIGQVLGRADRELTLFHEGAWWRHQDLYVLRKTA